MTSHNFLTIRRPQSVGAAVLMRLLALAGALLVVGCATGPNANPRDPLEPMNRKVAQFNEVADAIVLKPIAIGYREIAPAIVRTGVSNFYGNLRDLGSAANSLLQLKFRNGFDNLIRFQINTFIGMGGLLDVASELQVERHSEDLGQTLGHWGVPSGPYLVLPLLGSSTVRDALAFTADRKFDLVGYIPSTGVRQSFHGLRLVDARTNLLRASSVLDEAALDKYSFARDAHLQKRRSEIFDGDPPEEAPEKPAPPVRAQ